jgi:hypothetical protein
VYKVKTKEQEQEFLSLDLAIEYAKLINEFVTISGGEFEIVGRFGVDSVVDGKTPDGVAYTWNKESRIGKTRK